MNDDSPGYLNFEELKNTYNNVNTVLNEDAVTQLFGSLEYVFDI